MLTKSLLAISGLVSMVAAIPMAAQHQHHPAHDKRIYVWETATKEIIVTVPVTKTVWLEPGQTPPVQESYTHATLAVSSSLEAPAASSAPVAHSAVNTPAIGLSTSLAPAPIPQSTSEASSPQAIQVVPTTPAFVAPAPTTTSTSVASVVAPTEAVPPPSAASSPAPASGVSGVKNDLAGMARAGTSYTGDLTYYSPGLGACGITNTDSQNIVAISHEIWDAYMYLAANGNPNNNPLCGKTVTITSSNGTTVQGQITDKCGGCQVADLDLSPSLFSSIENMDAGRVHNIDWSFN